MGFDDLQRPFPELKFLETIIHLRGSANRGVGRKAIGMFIHPLSFRGSYLSLPV